MSAAPVRIEAVEIDSDIRERLRRLADARHSTEQGLVRDAIAEYVEREERRNAFRQDAVAAWNEYRSNGLHATSAETDAWLAKLESGEDAEPPACHR